MKFPRIPLLALLAAVFPLAANAQGYPDKAVRVIVPFPAGGAADIVARHFTTRLSPLIGQQIGQNLDIIGWLLRRPVVEVIDFVFRITGNG